MTSQSEVARKLHACCTGPDKVLKRNAYINDELDIPWDLGIGSVFSGDESFLHAACVLFELCRLLLIHHGSPFHLHHLDSEVTRMPAPRFPPWFY